MTCSYSASRRLIQRSIGAGWPWAPASRMARTKATQLITRPYVKSPSTPDTATPAKEYVNEGRALRIETVINDPTDLGVLPRLTHLDDLQAKARAVNRRLLDHEHVDQGCVLASPALSESRPSLLDGRRPSRACGLCAIVQPPESIRPAAGRVCGCAVATG